MHSTLDLTWTFPKKLIPRQIRHGQVSVLVMDAKIADVAWKSDMAFRFSMARIVTRGVILDFAYIFALTMLFCVYVNAM